MKKTLKPVKKELFLLDIPIYGREVCVVVGMTHKEALASAKRKDFNSGFFKVFEQEEIVECCKEVAAADGNIQGSVKMLEGRFFMFLRPYRNHWDYLDTLNHECFHLTQFMSGLLRIWDDVEAPAYLHGFIFEKLRRKLSGIHD